MIKQNTILIVDDEWVAREMVKGMLMKEPFHLAFASDGFEALAMLEEVKPDLILSDVMMPGMDGFDLCQQIKSDNRWQHIPIILITALDDKQALVRGFDAGADDFLSKPTNSIELRARTRAMLRIKNQFDQLQMAIHMREKLSSMIVHDMRNPLTAITGYAELLTMVDTPTPGPEYIEHIRSETTRLNAFLTDMLMLAKMQSGNLLLNLTEVDLNELIEKTAKNFYISAQYKQIEFVFDRPASPQVISLDSSLVQRLIDNLVSNALKFAPDDSQITLRVINLTACDADGWAGFSVIDQGPGVPEADRKRIFESFETAKVDQTEGIIQVGLGLAFCKMVAEAHGWHIVVDANQPQGAIFTIQIPVSKTLA